MISLLKPKAIITGITKNPAAPWTTQFIDPVPVRNIQIFSGSIENLLPTCPCLCTGRSLLFPKFWKLVLLECRLFLCCHINYDWIWRFCAKNQRPGGSKSRNQHCFLCIIHSFWNFVDFYDFWNGSRPSCFFFEKSSHKTWTCKRIQLIFDILLKPICVNWDYD